jgi:hypothetical protein
VAELKTGRYTPRETTWAKIKNPNYSQAEGRGELSDRTGRSEQPGDPQ